MAGDRNPIQTNIEFVDMLMRGELPPVVVRVDKQSIAQIMLAFLLTFILITLVNRMFKK